MTRRLFSPQVLVSLLLGAWAVFNLVQTVQYVLADYTQIPSSDYWRVAQYWANPRTVHWANLWKQHNEHRIIFPELIFVADMFLLHGRMYLPIAFSGACYLAVWVVLAWSAYSQASIPSPARELALLLAGIVMAWKGCSAVIATPFQLQFTLLQLASALSLVFISKLADTRRLKYLVLVVAGGIVCTYSSANGMLLWIILVAAATLLRVDFRQILSLILAASVSTGAYFIRYEFQPSAISSNIKHPVQALEFLCAYFSMPFGGAGSRKFAIGMGGLSLLLMCTFGVMAWRRGALRTRLGLLVFGMYLFTLLSAVLTTLGRMEQQDEQLTLARAWRYATLPTVSWALVLIALFWMLPKFSRQLPYAATLLIAVGLHFGFKKDSNWVEGTRSDAANAQITATMLRNGVFDPDQVRTDFPVPEFARSLAKVLEANHKSIYVHGGDRWLGRNLQSLPVQETAVSGKITRVYPVAGGVKLFGWADTTRLSGDHEILFVDRQKQIVGFGVRPTAGMPSNLSTWDTPEQLAFVGYIGSKTPIDEVTAYVRTFHGKLVQPLNQKIEVPAFAELGSESDNAPVPGVTWLPGANWTLKGYKIHKENGPAPQGEIYASWSGSDQKTGTIRTAPFPAPANGCLILPELHGRSAYGQSVELQDADSKQVIADLPFFDGRSIWERWRIPIPAKSHNLVIEAQDQGAGENQWVAVAAPEQCP